MNKKLKKGKLQAIVVLNFYENSVEARIEKGFEHLNPGKIQRGIKQIFSAYSYKRREVLKQFNAENRANAEAARLEEETADVTTAG